MSTPANATKKTLYIDVEEEITGIIDKVRSADESIIALVLPKRATVLQSIVNMKLLKRAADQSKKRLVLITSEATLLPLAGAAGLHVAKNLQSRPYVPSAPGATQVQPVALAEADVEEHDPVIDPATPIGALTGDTSEPIEIDNTPKQPAIAASAAGAAVAPKKPKKDKSKKVPNFHKFRALIFAGAAAFILLLFGLYWAFAIAPKATITLRTESSETPVNAQFSADTTADTLDTENKVLPAQSKDLKKTESEKVSATGEKDNGTRATGTISLRNCSDNKVTIPAGTGVSSGSQTFITQTTITLKEGEFTSKNSGSQCKTSGDHTGSVDVTSQGNGDQYNLSPRSYTVSGFSSIVAQGDQMSGGTSKVVKVVAATDVETAKKKITDKQSAAVDELKSQLKDAGYIGIVDSFSAGSPTFTPSPAVGAEATEVTVTADITYTMIGVKEADLKKILESESKVDTAKQSILNYGLDDASYEVGAKKGDRTELTVKTTLVAGPEINQDSLKQELKGKKRGDAESLLKNRPGITDAKVEFKPFWVSKIPGKASKVTFVIQQADGKPVTQ